MNASLCEVDRMHLLARRTLKLLAVTALCLLACPWTGCEQPNPSGNRASTQSATQPATRPDRTTAGPVVHPGQRIPEADAMMAQAVKDYDGLAKVDRTNKAACRAVFEQFVKIISQYPQSDRVAEAYYFAAETLKEYLDDPKSAVEYYRRAYQADPALPHPARFQRATLLDFRLNQRKEAIEEYRNAITCESVLNTKWARPNADFATSRIRVLEGKE
jgi:hypothetical protein